MKRTLINIALLALIAYVGRYYIATTVMCWQEGGTWAYTEQVCHMGTYDLSGDATVSGKGAEYQPRTGAASYGDLLRIETPLPQARITSPVALKGTARGMWFFEASFPIRIRDASGATIGEGIGTAVGDWMTEAYVPFFATVAFSPQPSGSAGTIVLMKDNPSGMPENDDSFSLPIVF
jgi:hypothetical protein